MRAEIRKRPCLRPITVEDVLKSRMIAEPLHLLDCCLRTDGGGAVIVTGAEVARDCRKKPAWVIGTGEAVSHVSMSHMDPLTVSPARRSTEIAFGEAGIGPQDVDVLQCYDSFTITVILTLEAMGFCAARRGRGIRRRRKARMGWRIADEYRRWRSLVQSSRDARHFSLDRGGETVTR